MVNSEGPGISPWIVRPPMKMAVTALPGMPSVSAGISEPPVTALLAVSGAATPSCEPWPNSSGCFD